VGKFVSCVETEQCYNINEKLDILSQKLVKIGFFTHTRIQNFSEWSNFLCLSQTFLTTVVDTEHLYFNTKSDDLGPWPPYCFQFY